MNELCHLPEVIFHQASRGQRWRTKPQTTGAQSTLIPYKHMYVEILRMAFCREKRTFTRISHKDKGHTRGYAQCSHYLDRCSYCKQWHRLPGPSQLGLHQFLCCAGRAGSGGCQSRLHRDRKRLSDTTKTMKLITATRNLASQLFHHLAMQERYVMYMFFTCWHSKEIQ